MTEAVRHSLITQLEGELVSTLAKEQEERERTVEEAQKAAGAFPSLAAATSTVPLTSSGQTQPQTHKVLSLTSKKGVVVSSYTTTPVQSRPVSRSESIEEEAKGRVLKPSQEPPYSKEKVKPDRPWENLLSEGATYRPRSRLDDGADPAPSSSRRRKRNRPKNEESGIGNE